MNNIKQVEIKLPDKNYPIVIDSDGFNLSGQQELLADRKVMIVSNTTVAPLYLNQACDLFADNSVFTCVLPDGESHKNINSGSTILPVGES